MRKIIRLFLLCFLIIQLMSLSSKAVQNVEAPTSLSDKAGLSAEEEILKPNEWDFGKVKQDVISKHDFLFKNETSDILNILSINTSCGCTVSQSDRKTLAPQESTMINVSFNSRGYLGPVTQYVFVQTDNAALSEIRFIIKAEVIKDK